MTKSPHDYPHLIRRWRSAARARGYRLTPYATASGYELFHVSPRRPLPGRPWIYLSAGIHGDEAGATEGGLAWFETTRHLATDVNVLAFPCLNPWGLVHNQRGDEAGRDLNRTYHDDAVSSTAAHRAVLAARHDAALAGRRPFALALALHEDYDANGIYLYELLERRPYWGEQLLAAAARHLPAETRRSIEGRRCCAAGIVRRRIDPAAMPLHPEAFPLHFQYADRTFTIETPSEAAIADRADAHVAIIERAVSLTLARDKTPAAPRLRGLQKKRRR